MRNKEKDIIFRMYAHLLFLSIFKASNNVYSYQKQHANVLNVIRK